MTFLAENIKDYSECDPNEFACLDLNNTCLDRSAVCDGSNDCDNARDEDDSICKCTSNQVSFNRCPIDVTFKSEVNRTFCEEIFF